MAMQRMIPDVELTVCLQSITGGITSVLILLSSIICEGSLMFGG